MARESVRAAGSGQPGRITSGRSDLARLGSSECDRCRSSRGTPAADKYRRWSSRSSVSTRSRAAGQTPPKRARSSAQPGECAEAGHLCRTPSAGHTGGEAAVPRSLPKPVSCARHPSAPGDPSSIVGDSLPISTTPACGLLLQTSASRPADISNVPGFVRICTFEPHRLGHNGRRGEESEDLLGSTRRVQVDDRTGIRDDPSPRFRQGVQHAPQLRLSPPRRLPQARGRLTDRARADRRAGPRCTDRVSTPL